MAVIKPRINIEIANDFNLGFSAEFTPHKIIELWPQFVYTCQSSAISWIRGDLKRHTVRFGFDQNPKDYFRHSYEAILGYDGRFKDGITLTIPLAFRSGVRY